MAPPLTGFIMKAVGLGDAHKQIEAEKRARDDAADRRDFNRRMKHKLEEERHLRHLADAYDGSGPPTRGTAHGSTGGSTLESRGSSQLPRVHRDEISLDTLAEYELPWHWDKKDKNYIIIEIPFSERKLEEFRRHTLRNREQLEMNKSAVSGKEEVEKIKKWRKSVEPIQTQWEPERRHRRDPEQGPVRGLRDHDRGHGRVPQSGAHMNARQADYVRSAPKIPSSAQKFSRGPSLVSQKPDEIEPPSPKMRSPLLQVQEVRSTPRHRSQSSAEAGLHSRSTGPSFLDEPTFTDRSHQASRHPHRSQHRARHSQAPIEQLPIRSSSIARRGYGGLAVENTRQLPLRSARGSVQLGRERAPSSVRELEPRRGFPSVAGSLFEDGGERERRRGGVRRFA